MWFSIGVGIACVALGSLIAVAPGASARGLGPFHAFALVASVAVVLGQLLPDALSALGWPALLVFGLAFGAPRVLEGVRRRLLGHADSAHAHPSLSSEGPCSDVGLELSYAAFLLHRVGDGMGLSIFVGPEHLAHGHYDVIAAIGVHTVPVTALVLTAFKVRRGVFSALSRGAFVGAATLLGAWVPFALSPEMLHRVEPWLTAAVAGLFLHVGTHGWAPAGTPTTLDRVMDLVAMVAAVGVLALGSGAHYHDGAGRVGGHLPRFRAELAQALWDLALQIAPPLLLGLLLAALVQACALRLAARIPAGGVGRASQVVRGAFWAWLWPLAAYRALAVATSLRMQGVAPAFVVSFLWSVPGLGIDTLVLSAHLMGGALAAVRFLAGLLLVLVAALWFAAQLRQPNGQGLGCHIYDSGASSGPLVLQVLRHLEDLFYHVGAWMAVGLLLAAYAAAALGEGALRPLDGASLDVLLVCLLALPTYVCATSVLPLAAVLLDRGLSPGAVLIGLWLGPTVNLTTVGYLGRAYGRRAAHAAVVLLVLVGLLLAGLVNAMPGVRSLIAPIGVGEEHVHGWLSRGSVALLVALSLRAVWRSGLRTWLSSLQEVLVQELDAPAVAGVSGEQDVGSW